MQNELLEIAKALREYIDALPKDLELPAMPGVDRDWVDSVIEREEKSWTKQKLNS